MTPNEIGRIFKQDYQLEIYSGDILRFFDGINHRLKGIARIAKALNKLKLMEEIEDLIKQIDNPY